MEWLEVQIVVQNECFWIKSRIEALDGDRQSLVNERCFAAVTTAVLLLSLLLLLLLLVLLLFVPLVSLYR